MELQDVLKDLTKQTGVDLVAGVTSRDWRVQERKVTIYAKDTPLGTVIDGIGQTLDYLVTRSGEDGKWKYRIWQDKNRRDLESAMLTADEEALAEKAKELTQLTIDGAQKALNLSHEEALKLRKDDPWTAFLGGTDSGRAYAKLLVYLNDRYPTEHEPILRGRSVTINLADAPPEVREMATDALNGGNLGSMFLPMSGKAVADEITVSPVAVMGMGGEASEALKAGFGAMVMISGQNPNESVEGGEASPGDPAMAMYPFTHAASPVAKWTADAAFAVIDKKEQGADPEELIGEVFGESEPMQDEYAGLYSAATTGKSPTEQNPPTDPSLTREVELGKAKFEFSNTDVKDDSIQVISKAIDRPVMLESFDDRSTPVAPWLHPGKQPLYKILIALEKGGFTWAYDGAVLRIRPTDWALKRSCEVSKSFIQYYVNLLDKRGKLTLDNIAEIASSLTDEQLSSMFFKWPQKYNFVLTSELDPGNLDVLRFYADLNNSQRTLLKGKSGLPFSQLNIAQMQQVSEIIADQLGGVYVVDGNVRIEQAPPGSNIGMTTFAFTAQTDESEHPRSFTRIVNIMDKESISETLKYMKEAEAEIKAEEEKSAPHPASDSKR